LETFGKKPLHSAPRKKKKLKASRKPREKGGEEDLETEEIVEDD